MHVAYVQYGEILKRRRQLFKPDVIVPDENALCISARALIETGQFKRDTNDCISRVPVLDVKEVEALAEELRFMVRLDSQSLPRVQPPETFLQFKQDFFIHKVIV